MLFPTDTAQWIELIAYLVFLIGLFIYQNLRH